jgi:hypothetical protein
MALEPRLDPGRCLRCFFSHHIFFESRQPRFGTIIPVLVVENAADAVPIAEALVGGGLTALEVTLRTPAALDVIRAMSVQHRSGADHRALDARHRPDHIERRGGAERDFEGVGAGTVLNARDLDAAIGAGAKFIVSPGLTAPLTEAALALGRTARRAPSAPSGRPRPPPGRT